LIPLATVGTQHSSGLGFSPNGFPISLEMPQNEKPTDTKSIDNGSVDDLSSNNVSGLFFPPAQSNKSEVSLSRREEESQEDSEPYEPLIAQEFNDPEEEYQPPSHMVKKDNKVTPKLMDQVLYNQDKTMTMTRKLITRSGRQVKPRIRLNL